MTETKQLVEKCVFEIADRLKRVQYMLEDPQEGLATWWILLGERLKDIELFAGYAQGKGPNQK